MVQYKKARLWSDISKQVRNIHSAGPQGVYGRLPRLADKDNSATSREVVITDPYALYQVYVKLGRLEKDKAQVRVMKEFQKLHHRVLHYQPPQDLAIKTSLLLRRLEIKYAQELEQRSSNIRYSLNSFTKYFTRDFETQKRDVVKFMTDEEELQNIATPHGLLINGEVGCGKSLCMDIFASSLPHHSKMRWHYSNFMLWVFGQIHKVQQERNLLTSVGGSQKMTMENEFILFEIAQKLINKSTIFMLDEFMLPDVASAQIVRILFTYYFKLGGVLVATSNKLPEELYSTEFNKSRFKSFENILKSRCIGIDMKSTVDYRSLSASKSSDEQNLISKNSDPDHEVSWTKLIKTKALKIDDEATLDLDVKIEDISSTPFTLNVYGRQTVIPKTYKSNSVCYLDFDYICRGNFSSSDYITLASTFKTVIIDNIPVMTTKMKNEARRFITLLDALYEARCQLFLRCDCDVEKLFFPEDNHVRESSSNNMDSVQEEEMFAKTAIAAMNPYRPNISSYDQDYAKKFADLKTAENGALDYQNVKAFTGEDEKFAFKRAILRILEMVGSDQWRRVDQWVPIDSSMRPWELNPESPSIWSKPNYEPVFESLPVGHDPSPRVIKDILQDNLPRDMTHQFGIPFRVLNRMVAPKFTSLQHFWALGTWTLDQQKKVKDKIAKSWMSGGVHEK